MRLPSLVDGSRLFILFALSLLLGACVTLTVAPDPLKAGPRDDASTVVVSITANTAQISGFDQLLVRRIGAPGVNVVDLNSLKQILPDLSRDTTVFVGALPEGEYEFAELADMQTNRRVTLKDASRQMLGRFRVARGKVVDLGRLILTPLNYWVVMGRSARVTSNKPLLEKFAPEYAALLKGETSRGWLEPRNAKDSIEEYALSKPVGFDNPREFDDGTIIGASRLGSVISRHPVTKWSVFRSERLESLFCATPVNLPNARLVAVGEFSTLLRLPREGRVMVPVDVGNLPPGNLLFIDGDEAFGWYVAHQRGADLSLYHSLNLERGDWRLVRKEDVGFSFWNGKNNVWIWHTDRGLAYAVSAGSIHHLEYATGEWRTFKAPDDRRLMDVVPSPDGSIGILTPAGGGFAGVFASMFLSRDGGATWREIASKNKIKSSAPIPVTSKTILATSIANAFSPQLELNASHDNGATWEARPNYRVGEKLVPLRGGRMVSIQPGFSGIFTVAVSDDEGKTWRVGFSNYDERLDQSQKK